MNVAEISGTVLFAAVVVITLLTTAMKGPARTLFRRQLTRRRGQVPATDFRALMSAFPSGVAIVTAGGGDGKSYGMTCSSLCSVAIAPPTLLVCLRKGSPTLAAVLGRAAFTINLLHDQARSVAELFASGAPDRFERITWRRDDDAGGPHLIDHAHAIADCNVVSSTLVGDHVVVFGQVARVSQRPAELASPLLYGLGQYSSWPASAVGAAAHAPAATNGRDSLNGNEQPRIQRSEEEVQVTAGEPVP